MGIGRISFAAAQAKWDNMSPPEDDDCMVECTWCQGDRVDETGWKLATDLAETMAGKMEGPDRIKYIDKARRLIIDVLLQHNAGEYGCDHCEHTGEVEYEDTGGY